MVGKSCHGVNCLKSVMGKFSDRNMTAFIFRSVADCSFTDYVIKVRLNISALRLFLKTDQKGTKVEHNPGELPFLYSVWRAHNSRDRL